MDLNIQALKLHKKFQGKIATKVKLPLKTQKDLSLAYTPGVAAVSRMIQKDRAKVWEYTNRRNMVAVVSDGSAVLGLGDVGPEAALPVMEGKAALFKAFANIDAIPLVLATKESDEIVQIVKSIGKTFGGINLEDISAPRCFYIEERLKNEMQIPVLHDDQHGAAIVVLAGLINALKITGRNFKDIKVIISGAGAAGIAVTKILLLYGVKDVIVVDSKGVINRNRDDLNNVKKELIEITNHQNTDGSLESAIQKRDVFIGVSAPGVVTEHMVRSMRKDPIVFALANPVPEIMPQLARKAGARIVATGRSDFPNQLNNVLAFPGIFRGALDAQVRRITEEMKIAAAEALADCVESPTPEKIIPDPFDKQIVRLVAEAVKRCIQ